MPPLHDEGRSVTSPRRDPKIPRLSISRGAGDVQEGSSVGAARLPRREIAGHVIHAGRRGCSTGFPVLRY